MNFINKLKAFLFSELEVGIISFGNIVQIPNRDYFKEDIVKNDLINLYKEKYFKLLSQEKIINPKRLKFDNLQENMLMNVDLLLYNIYNAEDFLNLAPEELKIQMIKLKLYLSEIQNLETETITRLIALKEIKEEQKYLLKNSNILISEIDSLSNSLVIFLCQKNAIKKELDAYLKVTYINNSQADEELLNERYNKILFIASNNLPSNIDNFDSSIIKIAYSERLLEIYVYQNKEKIKLLDEELNDLIGLTINYTYRLKNRNDLLNKITLLEQKYLLFNEYGKNLITPEKINDLYKLKFDVLTCGMETLKTSPITPLDYGYCYYQDIIMQKIENILKGENNHIKKTFQIHELEAVNIISESLKNEYNEFDIEEILKDKLNLNLIVSFDNYNGFKKMLESTILSTKVKKENANFYELELLNEPHDYWSDSVPLKSYLSLIPETKLTDETYHKKWNIYQLYKLYEEYELATSTYIIPEGIKDLDLQKIPYEYRMELEKKYNKKTLIMPSTLKRIGADFFRYYRYPHNPDLITYDGNMFNGKIILSPSIEEIGNFALDEYETKVIIFDDYQNSKLLHNKEAFFQMLVPFTDFNISTKKGYSSIYYSSEYLTKESTLKLFTMKANEPIEECSLTLDAIIFEDDDTIISIRKSECTITKPTDYNLECDISKYDMFNRTTWYLMYKIQELILEKTGHNIFAEDNQKEKSKLKKCYNHLYE